MKSLGGQRADDLLHGGDVQAVALVNHRADIP